MLQRGRDMTYNPTDDFFLATDLINTVERYMEPEDIQRVYTAFHFAAKAHAGVTRKSGEPYITHPVEVARMLAAWHFEADVICAALLHDVVEDTEYTLENIQDNFGESVRFLVDGVTKLESKDYVNKQAVAEASFRKMMNRMTEDFRVVLIKLVDRLHNLRTLGFQKPEAKRRIALETIRIYIPMAHRLGMNNLRREMQALSFQALHPWRYRALESVVKCELEKDRIITDEITYNLTTRLQDIIPAARITVPDKNISRLYERMKRDRKKFAMAREVLEIRISVGTVDECYRALGVVHAAYQPRYGQIHDFIVSPKVNGFQALETVVLLPSKRDMRVLIQTRDMYQTSLHGIAAQWHTPGQNSGQRALLAQDALKRWQDQVREMGAKSSSATDFYDDMQADLYQTAIYAYTPKGDVKEFPNGATMVDFAFAIHTGVGHHCVGARLNGEEVPLRTHIPIGTTIEIITHKDATPQPSWLNFVATGRAKAYIRHWRDQQKHTDQLMLGQGLLQKALNDHSSSLEALPEGSLEGLLPSLNIKTLDDLYISIALNEQCSKLLAKRLLNKAGPVSAAPNDTPMLIKGSSGMVVHFQTCCYPLPQESILAVMNARDGLEVHRDKCNVLHENHAQSDILSVAWAKPNEGQLFLAAIQTQAHNVVGVLHHITQLMHELNVNIEDVNTSGDQRIKETRWVLWVRDLEHLNMIIKKVGHVPSIIRVKRVEETLSVVKHTDID